MSGAAAATAMFWLQGSAYLWGGALFIFANVSFGASVVVYNSFLPEIAPPEQSATRCRRAGGASDTSAAACCWR